MKWFLFLIFFVTHFSHAESFCDFLLKNTGQNPFSTLHSIVESGEPLSFDKALVFVLTNLPDGRDKDILISNLKNYFFLENDRVRNHVSLRSYLGSSRVKLSRHEFVKKVIWKARVPKTDEDALGLIFKAINLTFQPSGLTLNRMRIYFMTRASYIEKFLRSAEKIINLETSFYSANQSDFKEIKLPEESRIRIYLSRFRNLFFNLIWLRDSKFLSQVQLTDKLYNPTSPSTLRMALLSRFKPDITMKWYMTHIRNVQTAATLALLGVLLPEMGGAYQNERTLEKLQIAPINMADYAQAQKLLKDSDLEIQNLIYHEIAYQNPDLNNDEKNFLINIRSTLK